MVVTPYSLAAKANLRYFYTCVSEVSILHALQCLRGRVFQLLHYS
jgi:hypothetical protein